MSETLTEATIRFCENTLHDAAPSLDELFAPIFAAARKGITGWRPYVTTIKPDAVNKVTAYWKADGTQEVVEWPTRTQPRLKNGEGVTPYGGSAWAMVQEAADALKQFNHLWEREIEANIEAGAKIKQMQTTIAVKDRELERWKKAAMKRDKWARKYDADVDARDAEIEKLQRGVERLRDDNEAFCGHACPRKEIERLREALADAYEDAARMFEHQMRPLTGPEIAAAIRSRATEKGKEWTHG